MSNTDTFNPAGIVFILACLCASACLPVKALFNQASNTKDDITSSPSTQTGQDGYNKSIQSANVSKVTQEEKGVLSSSSITLERLLLGTGGEPVVKRQADGEAEFCTEHIDTKFIEPSDCTYGGQQFRLCNAGNRKIGRCISDVNKYCDFCQPGQTFMVKLNNCTECTPCKTCGPDEQEVTACGIYEDTICGPRPPDPTCPPCPVTQVMTSNEVTPPTNGRTTQLESTSPLYTTLETAPIIEPTGCPECKVNCTACEKDPEEVKSCPDNNYLIFIIVGLVIVIIVLLIILVWREWKLIKLERSVLEDQKKLKVNNNGNAQTGEVANEGRNANHQGRRDGAEINVVRPDLNVSRRPLLDSSLNPAGDSLQPASNRHPDEPPGGGGHQILSLKSIEPVLPSTAARPKDNSRGMSSGAGRISAEVHGQNNGESSTKQYPERHENAGIEMSTIRSDKSLTGLNADDTTGSSVDKTGEPKETDKFIPEARSESSDSGKKTNKKDKGGLKDKILSPLRRLSSSASSAKTDKDVDRNAKSSHLSVTSTKSRPEDLHLPTNSSPKSPDPPGSLATPVGDDDPSRDIPDPTKTGQLEVGASPTTEGPEGLQNKKPDLLQDNKQSSSPAGGSQSASNGHSSSLGANGDKKNKVPNGSSANPDKNRLDEVASELDFEKVANTLTPDELESLYRQLRLERPAIEHAKANAPSIITVEQAIAVLTKWKSMTGKHATRRAILEALRRGKHLLRADTLEGYFLESS